MFEALKSLQRPILVTGATGFKGSWLCQLLDELDLDYIGVGLNDRESHYYSTDEVDNRIHFLDMSDYLSLKKFLVDINPSFIIHMAASSLVLESYKAPFSTFMNNFVSTLNLLEIAKEHLQETKVLVTTTDKVYKPGLMAHKHVEGDQMWGQDPYSHSKVCVEALVSAYQDLGEVRSKPWIYVARAGNVIGGGDINKDRLFSDLGLGVLEERKIEIRNPQHTRPFQYVLDVLFGYLFYLESIATDKALPLSLNFASHEDSITVERASVLFDLRGENVFYLNESTDSNRENPTLDLDSNLTKQALGWQNIVGTLDAIKLTKQWWERVKANPGSSYEATQRNIEDYLIQATSIPQMQFAFKNQIIASNNTR